MPRKNTISRIALGAIACSAAAAFADSPASNYEFDFQQLHGDRAEFFPSGPATGSSPDVQGDAFLNSVTFPNGDDFIHFYRPSGVYDVSYTGEQGRKLGIRGGDNTTTGVTGYHELRSFDGVSGDVSATDLDMFADMALLAFNTNNLNTYVDAGSGVGQFYFTVKFELPIMDNDEDRDDFGEILFLERGAGYGNSYLKMQAVDDAGNPLGPWLVIDPNEMVQTTPPTTVYKPNQKIGTTSIDVSRLGVTEVQYLRVSNDMAGEVAYVPFSGSDTNPDFKLMAVVTHPDHLAMLVGFD